MHSKPVIACALVLLVLLGLSACSSSSERPEYQGAEYYKSLELPPDLTLNKSTAAVEIPEPSRSALSDFQVSSKLNHKVAPEFEGIRLMSNGSLYWLEADRDPDTVWPKLEAFWEQEGIRVIQNRPLLGFMETEWSKRLQIDPDADFFSRIFDTLEPERLDRFRVRVEAVNDHATTRVFVSHSGLEVEVAGDDVTWRGRPSDPELEREILSRMLLFAGLSENQALALLKDYQPYQSYVRYRENVLVSEEDQTSLENDRAREAEIRMRGSMEFVTRRAERALDRMQMKDVSVDEQAGTISFVTSDFRIRDPEVETDEVAESSWLMNLLTGGGEDQYASGKPYSLKLNENEGIVSIELLDERGNEASGVQAENLRRNLVKALQ